MSGLISDVVTLSFGILYPAYASHKALNRQDGQEIEKWLVYWIVFSSFKALECFTDVFLSWLPFYYIGKVVFIFYLLSPFTEGSSTLYHKVVRPQLQRREQDIDQYLSQAKEQGVSTVRHLGEKGVNLAVDVAVKGHAALLTAIHNRYSESLNAAAGPGALVSRRVVSRSQSFNSQDDLDGQEQAAYHYYPMRHSKRLAAKNAALTIQEIHAEEDDSDEQIDEEFEQILHEEYDAQEAAEAEAAQAAAAAFAISSGLQQGGRKNAGYSHHDSAHFGTLPRRPRKKIAKQGFSITIFSLLCCTLFPAVCGIFSPFKSPISQPVLYIQRFVKKKTRLPPLIF